MRLATAFLFALLGLTVFFFARTIFSEPNSTNSINYSLILDRSDSNLVNDTLTLKTNLGYEVELKTAMIRLDTIQLYECKNTSALWFQDKVVFAGHGDSLLNPAAVESIGAIDLTIEEELDLSAKTENINYCVFHQVFARDRVVDDPSLILEGVFSKGGITGPIELNSSVAYGKGKDVQRIKPAGSSLDVNVSYKISSIFDDIDFESDINDDTVATKIFANLIDSSTILFDEY